MTGTDFGSQYSLWDLSCAFKNGGVGGGGSRVKLFLCLRSHKVVLSLVRQGEVLCM